MKSFRMWNELSSLWNYPWIMFLRVVVLFLAIPSTGFGKDIECRPIEGASMLFKKGALVLVGEIHGTMQIPRFVRDLACAALERGFGVELGLEIPENEQSRLESFLASDGGKQARAALFENDAFWRDPAQDGRRSEAMFALIDSVRWMRQAGKDIALTPIDWAGDEKDIPRDEAMARNVRAIATKSGKAVTIVLTGNLHSRLMAGPENLEWGTPMGHYLIDLKPISLDPSYLSGSAWMCIPECGAHLTKGPPEAIPPWSIKYRDKGTSNYVFGVGAVTASPPAYQESPK